MITVTFQAVSYWEWDKRSNYSNFLAHFALNLLNVPYLAVGTASIRNYLGERDQRWTLVIAYEHLYWLFIL